VTSIKQETWDKLTQPKGDKLVARPALPEITQKLLCAIDAYSGRHLLIPLGISDEEFSDRQSRGFSVSTRDLSIQGNNAERYLDIACLDAGGNAILDLMGNEIATGLADPTKQSADVVRKVLAKWRRFWGQLPQPLMSREEQLGLFAELWFISIWLIPKFGPDAIRVWRGPWGSRHDFEWADKSVEVKATTNTRGRIHRIHGLNQLEQPENGLLYLFSVRMHEENGAEHSLPKIIETCRNQLTNSEESLAHFENGLAQLGYSPLFENEYSKMKLRILDDVLFIVDSNFPKLTQASFSEGLSEGIESIDYDINLNTYNQSIYAHRPSDLTFS
jgi:hypothetical protein